MAAPKKNTSGRAKKTSVARPKKTESKVADVSDQEMQAILKAQQNVEKAMSQAEQSVQQAMQSAQQAIQDSLNN